MPAPGRILATAAGLPLMAVRLVGELKEHRRVD